MFSVEAKDTAQDCVWFWSLQNTLRSFLPIRHWSSMRSESPKDSTAGATLYFCTFGRWREAQSPIPIPLRDHTEWPTTVCDSKQCEVLPLALRGPSLSFLHLLGAPDQAGFSLRRHFPFVWPFRWAQGGGTAEGGRDGQRSRERACQGPGSTGGRAELVPSLDLPLEAFHLPMCFSIPSTPHRCNESRLVQDVWGARSVREKIFEVCWDSWLWSVWTEHSLEMEQHPRNRGGVIIVWTGLTSVIKNHHLGFWDVLEVNVPFLDLKNLDPRAFVK